MHRSIVRALIVTAVAATALTAPASAWADHSGASPSPDQGCDVACQRDLARARAATAKYQDVAVALAHGFVPVPHLPMCVEGQGIHFVNALRLADPVAVAEPELLLYLPDGNGGLRLVGIEHAKIDRDQNLATDDDRPELYGQQFHGPMLGHDPLHAEPKHFELHVWLWSEHPTGVFAQENPALSCP